MLGSVLLDSVQMIERRCIIHNKNGFRPCPQCWRSCSINHTMEIRSGNLLGLYNPLSFMFCIVNCYPWHYGCRNTVYLSHLRGILTCPMIFVLCSTNQPLASKISSAWPDPLSHSPIAITSLYRLSLHQHFFCSSSSMKLY